MFLSVKEPPAAARVVLIDPDDNRRALFVHLLGDRDHIVAGSFADVETALAATPFHELVIFHAGAADATAVQALGRLRDVSIGAVMALTDSPDPDAVATLIAAGADQAVPVGVQSDRIAAGAAAAVALRTRLRATELARQQAEMELAEFKLSQRAKGVLMARQGLNEDEAHKRLQKMSMERNMPLPEMARLIIDAEELLC